MKIKIVDYYHVLCQWFKFGLWFAICNPNITLIFCHPGVNPYIGKIQCSSFRMGPAVRRHGRWDIDKVNLRVTQSRIKLKILILQKYEIWLKTVSFRSSRNFEFFDTWLSDSDYHSIDITQSSSTDWRIRNVKKHGSYSSFTKLILTTVIFWNKVFQDHSYVISTCVLFWYFQDDLYL